MVRAAGAQLGEVRRFMGNLVEQGKGQPDAGFVGDGRQVQCRVRAAADGHVDGDGVLEGVQGHDVAGQDLFLHEADDRFACFLGEAGTVPLEGGRNGAVAGQAHAEYFGQAVHGVGRKQAGAGTAAGAGGLFNAGQFGLVDLAGFKTAGGFEGLGNGNVVSLVPAGQHGTAAAEHRRDVHAQGRHQHAGDDFVAVGDHDHAVKRMAVDQCFHAVRNQFAAGEGVLHAFVAHGDAVADADGRYFDRNAAGSQNAVFDIFGLVIQVGMAGNDFALGVDHGDHGFLHVLFREAQGIEQRTVGGAGRAFFDEITT